MNIQTIKSRKLDFSKSETIRMPANFVWPSADAPLLPPDYVRVSVSWDGHAEAWRIPAPEDKVPLKDKPRVWYCTEERIWKAQRALICGRGTTRTWAVQDMLNKERE